MTDTSSTSGSPRSRQRVTVRADTAQLARLRLLTTEHLRALGAPDDVVADLELVVSELATNVIQHSDSTQITAVVEKIPDGWTLDVFDADDLRAIGPPDLPNPITQQSGRGLVIVHALMDSVQILELDGHRLIHCVRHSA